MLGIQSGILRKTLSIQRRHAGGFLRKNIRVEENAGIRESSYKTWTMSPKNIITLTFGLFIPSYLVYQLIIDENARKDKQVGNAERQYGILFSLEGSGREHYKKQE